MLYVDIHTHKPVPDGEICSLRNLFPGEEIPDFRGNNYYSVGLHPWYLKSPAENDVLLGMVEEALSFGHVLAAGECGLDKRCNSDFGEQKRVFLAQAQLAEKYRKPVIVHSVKAYNEMAELRKLSSASAPWILHGYSGSLQLAAQLAKAGFLFSFGEILFNRKAKASGAFLSLPVEKIFLETDVSDVAIKAVYDEAARLKQIEAGILKKQVGQNFKKIFLKDGLA